MRLLATRSDRPRPGGGAFRLMAAWVAVLPVAALGAALPAGMELRAGDYQVLAFNNLGMHCMNEDFSELVILPPYNTVRAQVIKRAREEPKLIDSGVTVRYLVPTNTHSYDKTNFWTFAPAIFGVNLPPDVGLTGHGLSGTMYPLANHQWEVSGIPITPWDDSGQHNPYPLATIVVEEAGVEVARTQTVVPVSAEITCNICHADVGISTETTILRAHDRLHGTDLEQHKPVLCAACHADPALGAPGQPGVPTLSASMHGAHAPRMGGSGLANDCYACHPGVRTHCQRDVHFANGIECTQCHGDMYAMGNQQRTPWVDEPRCGNCHSRQGFEFEQPGKLFQDSRGHGGVGCPTCHASPHAITPAVTATDNVQSMRAQGHVGMINDCLVCHTRRPDDPFPHRLFD